MRQNNFLKTAFLLLAVLGGTSFAWGAAGDVTAMPTSGSIVLNKADATPSGTIDNTKESTGEYGSIKEGGTLLFKLSNTTAQKYTFSLQAGAINEGSSFDIQLLSNDQTTVEYSQTINVFTTGGWGNWFTYYFTTSSNVATTGENEYKYLKIIFHQSDNNTFVCNAQNITITAGDATSYTTNVTIPNGSNDVTITPGTTTSTIFSGSTKDDNNVGMTFDNFGGSGRAIYVLQNNTEQKYRIAYKAATANNDGTLTLCIYNSNYELEASKEESITQNGWTNFNDYLYNMTSNLTTGRKFLVMKFKNVNVGPLTITPIAGELYTLTTSASPAEGGTVTPATGTFEAGSNITVNQKAKWGYSFTSWTVDDTAAGSETSYTISSIAGNHTVVANFSVNDGIFQSIPTAAESYLDLTKANPDLATNGKPTASYLDNYRGGEQTQFALRSTTAQRYFVSFKTARQEAGTASLTFSFATKAAPETTVFSVDKTIESNGSSWETFDKTYSFATNELAAGDWIMTITYNGSGTTCNMKDFAIVPYQALDESSDYTAVATSNTTVTLTRTITAGNWSTICLPFALNEAQVKSTFGTNVKLAQFTAYNNSTVTMSEATSMNANEPYMIKVAENEYNSPVTIEGVTIEAPADAAARAKTISPITFQGVYTSTEMAAGDFFVANNQLYKATKNTKAIKPFRAYFTGVPAKARLAFFDDETTGVNDVRSKMEDVRGDFYNLAGQRVAQPTKGLYIVNGKKVVIK